jgi:glyoxylase-like metal-dependent hydrolase (beta-lactamase superfamily II)
MHPTNTWWKNWDRRTYPDGPGSIWEDFQRGDEFERDGSQFDRLFKDGDHYQIGDMVCSAIYTPGHTLACIVHFMGDTTFSGETLFMPDGGDACADFPGGDAGQLFVYITRVLSLPEEVRLFVCHDYGPGGRVISWEKTIGTQKLENIHLGKEASRAKFVAMREA